MALSKPLYFRGPGSKYLWVGVEKQVFCTHAKLFEKLTFLTPYTHT